MEPRKSSLQEPTLFQMRKAISVRLDDNDRKGLAGVGEHGMHTEGSFRNLGDPSVSVQIIRIGETGRTSPWPISGSSRSGMGANKRVRNGI